LFILSQKHFLMTGPEDEVTLLGPEETSQTQWKGGLIASQRCDTDEDLCCGKQAPQKAATQPNPDGAQY
jgi:hypothetical protein